MEKHASLADIHQQIPCLVSLRCLGWVGPTQVRSEGQKSPGTVEQRGRPAMRLCEHVTYQYCIYIVYTVQLRKYYITT